MVKFCEKVVGKVVKKWWKSWWTVKKFVRGWLKKSGGGDFGCVLWKKSGKICTGKMVNIIFGDGSFASFARRSIIATNLERN